MTPMLKPMLASLDEAPLSDPQLVYEPKYDGIRIIAEVRPGEPARLWSRLGNDKTSQFPEVAEALARWGRRLHDAVILDGEVVALDADGRPPDSSSCRDASTSPGQRPVTSRQALAFIAFDVLRAAGHDLREQPLHRTAIDPGAADGVGRPATRRDAAHQRTGARRRPRLYERALASGWEGLIAKHVDSRYTSGKRTPDWRKLKIVHEQEFVIGGWTEPRHARSHFGALLLGVYDDDRLIYAGHTGTGFDERELARVMALLTPRERQDCPFTPPPKPNERPHWVRPDLVAQVKFTEWTADGKLRHPVYLGLRDDKAARTCGANRSDACTPVARRGCSPPRRALPIARRPRPSRRRRRGRRHHGRPVVGRLPPGSPCRRRRRSARWSTRSSSSKRTAATRRSGSRTATHWRSRTCTSRSGRR